MDTPARKYAVGGMDNVFRTTLLLKTKQGDVMMQWGSGDLGRVAGLVWTFVETNRDGDADMEHIYLAGRPAFTKQIASTARFRSVED